MATSIYAKPIKAKTILKFTLPTVLMMVFMSLYTVVDGIVVANCVGSDALSAINIVYPFTLVFMAVGLMFSTGSNAIIAKKMGEGKQEEANRLMVRCCNHGNGHFCYHCCAVHNFCRTYVHDVRLKRKDSPLLH